MDFLRYRLRFLQLNDATYVLFAIEYVCRINGPLFIPITEHFIDRLSRITRIELFHLMKRNVTLIQLLIESHIFKERDFCMENV